MAPWSASKSPFDSPPWNPLFYDSIGQFYPWRQFAATSLRSGTLPLWNPYQFCGSPFAANSQSAILYPGNALYLLLPASIAVGWTAALHMFLAGIFMILLLKYFSLARSACLLGSVAWVFSTWQVSWLHLPTFLDTSCWLPLLLLLTFRLFDRPSFERMAGMGLAVGMTLLAGHLQIALYVLIATFIAALVGLRRAIDRKETVITKPLYAATLFVAALGMGGMLSAPQVLPTLELSRRSHRVSTPNEESYTSYVNYAVSPTALATLFAPDLYGNPSNPDSPYFGQSKGGMYFNYAEGALYTGLVVLLFAGFALCSIKAGRKEPVVFLSALAILALLLAFGTFADRLLYFYLPGFGSSGAPGRALVLWAFAMAALGAIGFDRLLKAKVSLIRPLVISSGILLALGAICQYTGMGLVEQVRDSLHGAKFNWDPQFTRQGALLLLSVGSVALLAHRKERPGWMLTLPLVVLMVDLFATGMNYNPTCRPGEIYHSTALTAYLQDNVGHNRIAPINPGGFPFAGPDCILPPNTALALKLRDVQGYDSLFIGMYKQYLNRLNGRDSSPPEVGNMVFIHNANNPLLAQTGATLCITRNPTGRADERELDGVYVSKIPGATGRAVSTKAGPLQWQEDSVTRVALQGTWGAPGFLVLRDANYPGWKVTVDGHPDKIVMEDGIFRKVNVSAGEHLIKFMFQPDTFRVGLYMMLIALAIATTAGACTLLRRRNHGAA